MKASCKRVWGRLTFAMWWRVESENVGHDGLGFTCTWAAYVGSVGES